MPLKLKLKDGDQVQIGEVLLTVRRDRQMDLGHQVMLEFEGDGKTEINRIPGNSGRKKPP